MVMKKHVYDSLVIVVFLLFTACSTVKPVSTDTPTPAPLPSSTPDVCSGAELQSEVKKINDLTRQFDDYSTLAFNTPQSQLVQVIPALQTIRRAAQDQVVPPCLQVLKNYQLSYMNTGIETLLVFESNSKSTVIGGGIAQARLYHDQYTIELAHLLGLTLVVPATITGGTSAAATTTPISSGPTSGFAIMVVTNPGPNPINLRSASTLASPVLGTLNVGQSTTAVNQSGDGKWYQVDLPGQPGKTAWLLAALVKISGTPIPTP
jgi:Bacterial SH3 domain